MGDNGACEAPASVPVDGQDALDLSDPLVAEELARAGNESVDEHSEVPHDRSSLASELRRDKLPDDLVVGPRSLLHSLDPEGLHLVCAHLEHSGDTDRSTCACLPHHDTRLGLPPE